VWQHSEVHILLTNTVLLGCPFSSPLAKEGCLCLLHFQVVGFFSSKSGMYGAKNKSQLLVEVGP
jgi:hypothetical protein